MARKKPLPGVTPEQEEEDPPGEAENVARKVVEEVKVESKEIIEQQWINKPFTKAEVMWEVIQLNGNRCLVRPTISPQNVYDRLDEAFGPANWSVGYSGDASKESIGYLCTLRVRLSQGYAMRTAVGGTAEAAFMNAAEMLGIGRYLKRVVPVWTDFDTQKQQPKPPHGDLIVVPGAYWFTKAVPIDPLPAADPNALAAAAREREAVSQHEKELKKEAERQKSARDNGKPADDLSARIKAWGERLAKCKDADEINAILPFVSKEKQEHKRDIRDFIIQTAEDAGYQFNPDTKKFSIRADDEPDTPNYEEGIPF